MDEEGKTGSHEAVNEERGTASGGGQDGEEKKRRKRIKIMKMYFLIIKRKILL